MGRKKKQKNFDKFYNYEEELDSTETFNEEVKESKKNKKKRRKKDRFEDEEDEVIVDNIDSEFKEGRELGVSMLEKSSDEFDSREDIQELSDFTSEDVDALNTYLNDIVELLGFVKASSTKININNYEEDLSYYITKESKGSVFSGKKGGGLKINIPMKVDSGLFQVKDDLGKMQDAQNFAMTLGTLPENSKIHFHISQVPLSTDDLILKYKSKLDNTLMNYENASVKEKLVEHFRKREEKFTSELNNTYELAIYVVYEAPLYLSYEELSDEQKVSDTIKKDYRVFSKILQDQLGLGIILDYQNINVKGIYSMLLFSLNQENKFFKDTQRNVNLKEVSYLGEYTDATQLLSQTAKAFENMNRLFEMERKNKVSLTNEQRELLAILENQNNYAVEVLDDLIRNRAVLEEKEGKIKKLLLPNTLKEIEEG